MTLTCGVLNTYMASGLFSCLCSIRHMGFFFQGRKLSDFTPDCILGIHFWQVFIHVLFAVSSVSTMLGVGRFPLPSSPGIHASNPCTLLTSTKTVKSAFSIQHN